MKTNNQSFTDADIFRNKILNRNGSLGTAACKIIDAAIEAVNPYDCVADYVKSTETVLEIGHHHIDYGSVKRIFVIGFGKASVPMAKALIDILGEKITFVKVITKDEHFLSENGYQDILEVYLGGHPLPTRDSVKVTREILQSLPELFNDDLVLILVSGGGSALFTDPIEGLDLDDLQELTRILLRCGANIHEFNTLRKHLDNVKGGRLALKLQPASVHTLILSDVIGDKLDMIASGPTIPDPTTFSDAKKVIAKYNLEGKVPLSILTCLDKGIKGEIPETLKPSDFLINVVHQHLVGGNINALRAAKQHAEGLGYRSQIASSHLTGDTDDVAEFLMGMINSVISHGEPINPPACLIFGGETTVVVQGEGKGGRNQDLTLKMVRLIADIPKILFVSLATDGEDGPTDAAGAVTDGFVLRDSLVICQFDLNTYIKNNDAYHFFDEVGGLIKTGSTGTNVNDLVLILIDH